MADKKPLVAGRKAINPKTPLSNYAEKEITPVMSDYVEWLKAQTGYDVDPLSVQLSGVLRGTFQKSQFNQDRIAARAQEREQEALDRAARADERAAKRAAREEARAAKAAAPKPEKVAKPVKAAPAAKTTAGAKTTAKVAAKPVARRRPIATKSASSDF